MEGSARPVATNCFQQRSNRTVQPRLRMRVARDTTPADSGTTITALPRVLSQALVRSVRTMTPASPPPDRSSTLADLSSVGLTSNPITETFSGFAVSFRTFHRSSAAGMPLAAASPLTSGFIASSRAETGIDGSFSSTWASG